MPTIYGLIERITYYNEENDFIVAKLQEKGKRELTTIVGNLSGINPGESLKLAGRWVHNKKFGEQFQVENYEITVPATVNGIKKYLGSGLIKGIGPIMADRIVKKFALETLDIKEKTPERLSEVDGIGPKRIAMITKAWEELKEIKNIMIFLQGHGVSAAYSAKIYKQYRERSIEVVKENPYRLAHDIHGIGFITADKIAQNIGIDPNSLIRAKAGVIHVLNDLTEEGQVYYPEIDLIRKANEILKVDQEVITGAISELFNEKEIFIEVCCLACSQSRRIRQHQNGLMLEILGNGKEGLNLREVQNNRKFSLCPGIADLLHRHSRFSVVRYKNLRPAT